MNTPYSVQHDNLRSDAFEPPRRRWPGLLAAGVIGVGIAAAAVSSFYHPQLPDEHSIAALPADPTPDAGSTAADSGITAAVKTALASDPSIGVEKIAISTHDGIVVLEGAAPDDRARERAEVLAAAPPGVRQVDNRLVVAGTTAN